MGVGSMRQTGRALARRGRHSARRVADHVLGPSAPPRFPSIEASLETLRARGFECRTAVDVGAYEGTWTRMFKAIFPSSRILMVEAQEAKQRQLHEVAEQLAGDAEVAIALLGPEDGRQVRFVEMGTGSSVFEENSPYDRQYVEKTLVSLDAVIDAHPRFNRVDFLKLDVQGYELEVLRGASRVLSTSEFVLAEASLIQTNSDCPLIFEVMSFLAANGFRLLDFCSQIRRRDGALWQTDLLFVREDSSFVPSRRVELSNWG